MDANFPTLTDLPTPINIRFDYSDVNIHKFKIVLILDLLNPFKIVNH